MSKKKRNEKQKQHHLDEDLENVSPFNRVVGIIFAMSSCIFFAISSLLVKLLQEMPSQEVVFFRSLVQVIFVLPPLIYGKVPIIGNAKNLPFLCVRGVAGTLALCCQFYAFQHMPLADATVIVFSSPVFTGVLAYFLLGEAWGLFDVLATLWCFTGVVLIARPTFLFSRAIRNTEQENNWEQVTASLAALCGAILTSIALIAIRKLKGVNTLVPVLYVGLSSVVLTTGAILVSGSFQTVICGRSHEWFLLGLGFCGLGGQTLLTRSLQLERAGVVALIRTLDIAFAFVFQLLFLDYTANIYSIVGASLVLGGNVVIILNRAWFIQRKDVTGRHDEFPDEMKSLMGDEKRQLHQRAMEKYQ
ncbi:solute carrier family 35 member G1-like [Montipora foliosa]|uniref:solute carrier family 35 member G1-like n=1 Tax=Montipora foliosa TaxID=591990 RepID=UPI0035F14760